VLPFLGVFAAAAVAVAVVTPVVRRLAVRFGAIDRPSERKVHPKPTPTGGGIGVLIGVAVGFGVAYLIPSLRPAFQESSELQGALLAGGVIALVGLMDDVRALSAPAKVAGQVLAAGLLILFGVQLLFFWFPSQGTVVVGSDVGVPLTVVWVLLMVNAVNLIDGLDGLAAGICVIAAAAFFVYVYAGPTPTFDGPTPPGALISAVTAGAALGFLPHNFHPARIFMGDSGSMLLGLLLATATISGVGRTLAPTGGDIAAFSIPILIPLIVLAVPLSDVAMAVVRRLRRGRPVFAPDKDHIHYRLQEIGHTHRRAVLVLYLWSILLAGCGLAITFINGWTILIGVVGASLLVILATVVPQRIRQGRARRHEEAPTAPATPAKAP
jgi:UDP-GlcNAc:undecaprenyl-phosphate GlcNAc-1-phosphate transferase